MIKAIKKFWSRIFPKMKPSIPVHSINPQEKLAGAFVRNYARNLRDDQRCFPINIDLMAHFNGKSILELNEWHLTFAGFADRTTAYVPIQRIENEKRVVKAVLFARQILGHKKIEVKIDPYNPAHKNSQEEIDALNLACAILIPDGAMSHMLMVQNLTDPRDLAREAGVTVRCAMYRLRHLTFG